MKKHNFGRIIYLLALGLLVFAGCSSQQNYLDDPAMPRPTTMPHKKVSLVPSPLHLIDITQAAGIKFRQNNGAFGLKFYPESMGSGAAFIDYDGDGYPDIFFVNGRDWKPAEINAYKNGAAHEHHKTYGFDPPTTPPYQRTTGKLYHNNRNGTFTDVTKGSGLDIEMYGMGVAVGDYDNDGRPDMYVTGYGRNYLFHNEGGGKFKEVAQQAGVQDSGFSTSAAWVDYDRDGKLDLFVCHYIKWNPAIDLWNFGTNTRDAHGYGKGYSGPNGYDGEVNHLYRNLGHGHFADVSVQAGIRTHPAADALSPSQAAKFSGSSQDMMNNGVHTLAEIAANNRRPEKRQGKAMGVTLCDIDQDGWPDLIIANDQVPTTLLRNNHNGTFTDLSVPSGLAYSVWGGSRAGMGVDTGDMDHSGRDSMVVGNFDHEFIGLYQNQGGGIFSDIAAPAEVAGASRTSVTFGCAFLDIDNDGWLDILAANGHAQDTIHNFRHDLQYQERPLLYLNRRQQQPVKFDEIGEKTGVALQKPIAGRGLAYADIDLDGYLDVLITTLDGVPELLHNEPAPGMPRNNALRLTLIGTQSNRSAIGARVAVIVKTTAPPGQMTVRRMVKSGSSYLSQSELPLTLGLGQATAVESLTIDWPSGHRTQLQHLTANQALTIDETAGIVQRLPLKPH